ncbi:MAG: very short patch repair endonuclease [bacterium]|nr:very short patch repair endonuclease [Candidatus Sumerlaeota bacterium]
MSRIRSSGNKSTEWRLRALLVRYGFNKWKLHPADITGRPDIVFPGNRIAIFLDGCFWHGCPKCGRVPKSNRKYWAAKLETNRRRDRAVNRRLRKNGWHVIRFWECQIQSVSRKSVIDKISRFVSHTDC